LDMTAKNSCAGMNLSMRLPVTYRYYQSINWHIDSVLKG
jgi:hypothetical protein